MAIWWEIAIPATTTLVGALSGGFLTARWHRSTSRELLDRQLLENERARASQMENERRARLDQLAHDDYLRLSEKRELVYAEFRLAASDAAQLWIDDGKTETRCRILAVVHEVDVPASEDLVEIMRSIAARVVQQKFNLLQLIASDSVTEGARHVLSNIQTLTTNEWQLFQEFTESARSDLSNRPQTSL